MSSRIGVTRLFTLWLLTLGLLVGVPTVGAFQTAQSHDWPVEPQAEVELGVARSALSHSARSCQRKNDLIDTRAPGRIAPDSPPFSTQAFSPLAEPPFFYSKLHKLHSIFRI
jgi:hypothetical protein